SAGTRLGAVSTAGGAGLVEPALPRPAPSTSAKAASDPRGASQDARAHNRRRRNAPPAARAAEDLMRAGGALRGPVAEAARPDRMAVPVDRLEDARQPILWRQLP